MVKHVVMWTLKEPGRAQELKSAVDGMKGRVAGLTDLECGIDFIRGEASCDLVLISTHASREELDRYQADPVHGEVKKLIGPAAASRHAVDFETP